MNETSIKEDSRVLRSKRDLANALEELLQEKNLDDISITEITKRAMVSKNTFYNNFEDKSSLLNFLFRRYAIQLDQTIKKILDNKTDDKEANLYECAKSIVHFFYSSKLSFEKIVKSDKSKNLYWAVNAFIKDIIEEIINRYSEYFNQNLPQNLIGYVYAGAISNMIYYMYNEETSVSEDECIQYIYNLLTRPVLK